MLRRFLYDQLYPNSSIPSSELSIHAYPEFHGRVHVFYNATATFRAPSDLSGIGGMRREYIRATPSWRNGHPRYDTVFINSDSSEDGMGGLEVARILQSILQPDHRPVQHLGRQILLAALRPWWCSIQHDEWR
jgi:hypothetical protein